MLNLNTPITNISSVGKTIAGRLKKLGLEKVEDLLYYYPFRYDDFSKINNISQLKPNTQANIQGQVELIQNKRSPRKKMYITEALVRDPSDTIKVIWFNQPFNYIF